MVTSKEYLLFSILSYYNLNEKMIASNVLSTLEAVDVKKSISSSSSLFKDDFNGRCEDYFSKELKEWQVFNIDDRTGRNKNTESNSGFYAVVFNRADEYVIAYRGSETNPIEEAYKDFVETDLRIGLGKKPLQFWEGLETLENLLKRGIPFEKISITGHSLGGGIAQFVAIMFYKKYKKIPYTVTWNSVGINKDGIIGFEDFLDYEKVLESCNLLEEEKAKFLDFKESYIDFYLKELKRKKVIKDNKTVLIEKSSDFYLDIDENFIERLIKETNFKQILSKFSSERQKSLLINEQIIEKFFQLDNLLEILYKTVDFIEILNKNEIFNKKVINFCHSKDLVSFLFPHIGLTYQVDKNFLKKDTGKQRTFFKNFFIFRKSVQSYHFEDVFIPFLDYKGDFEDIISLDYVSSVTRKVLYLEKTFSRDFLGKYFSMIKADNDNYLKIKENILEGIKKSKENILYKEKVFKRIELMEFEEIKILWEKIIKKFPSPYISQDIYDLIVFRDIYSKT